MSITDPYLRERVGPSRERERDGHAIERERDRESATSFFSFGYFPIYFRLMIRTISISVFPFLVFPLFYNGAILYI